MIEITHTSTSLPKDPLFLERFQVFMEKSLTDMKTFADREHQPLDETRKAVAEWHCTYLFGRDSELATSKRTTNIHFILREISRTLETLYALSGIHSFILAVDPTTASEDGFLGGTDLGREFWRGFRGGGDAGAQSLRAYCLKRAKGSVLPGNSGSSSSSTVHVGATKRGPASSLKADVYTNVRDALRSTSGIRTAEMKWSNHDRLSAYNIQLIGWPSSIPHQNPSAMTAGQNKIILEALADGTMRFKRTDVSGPPDASMDATGAGARVSATPVEDMSWTCHDDGQSIPLSQNLHHSEIHSRPVLQRHDLNNPTIVSPTILPDVPRDPAAFALACDLDRTNDLICQRQRQVNFEAPQANDETTEYLNELFTDREEYRVVRFGSPTQDERPSKKLRPNYI